MPFSLAAQAWMRALAGGLCQDKSLQEFHVHVARAGMEPDSSSNLPGSPSGPGINLYLSG
eukprot:scaffold189875_cov13-Tisochrysis_lutea.AAC.1